MMRVGRSLFATIPDSRMVGAQDIREGIIGRFAERIAEDCQSRFAMMDLVEVQFDLALTRFRKTALRQIDPVSLLTTPLPRSQAGSALNGDRQESGSAIRRSRSCAAPGCNERTFVDSNTACYSGPVGRRDPWAMQPYLDAVANSLTNTGATDAPVRSDGSSSAPNTSIQQNATGAVSSAAVRVSS